MLLSAAGHDLQAAAGLVGMSRKTAERTLRLFEAEGVTALRCVPRPGPVSALGTAAREQVKQVLRQSPREHGYATHNWTGAVLRDYLIRTFQVTLSVDQVQRSMPQVGVRRVRARRRLAKGEARRIQRARRAVGRLQRQPKPGWAVIDLDECHARFYPTVSHVWTPVGEYPVLPLLDVHGKCVVVGAVDLHTGRTFPIWP